MTRFKLVSGSPLRPLGLMTNWLASASEWSSHAEHVSPMILAFFTHESRSFYRNLLVTDPAASQICIHECPKASELEPDGPRDI